MKVDIIVLNYNGLNFLKTCVQSIYQYTLQRYRLIVVDNGSTETGTAEYLKQIERKPNTIVVRKEENTGFPGGINAGLEVAESDIVVLANNDLLFIDKHWLDKMLRFLRHDVVAVSCKLIYPNNKIQFAGSTLDPHAFSSYNLFRHRGRFERRELYSVESEEMPFVTFALVVAERKALGKLDTIYGKGTFEDVDKCTELRSKGYKLLYTGNTEVYHYESPTFLSFEPTKWRQHQFINLTICRKRWIYWMWKDIQDKPELYGWSREHLEKVKLQVKKRGLFVANGDLIWV